MMRFFFIWLALAVTAAAAVPRLAIVRLTEQEPLPAFCDLLAAELTTSAAGCELVEREELRRLEQEAEVQRLRPDERPLALARLAKADGLVFISPETSNPKEPRLARRLVDCSSGLIQQVLLLRAEPKDLLSGIELAAQSLRLSAPRLSKENESSRKVVSLLGLSSAHHLNDPLAVPLNIALTSELSAQPGVFVSERWRLEDVVFERSLAASNPRPISTGDLLVDGSFERKDGRVVVRLRLRSREKEAGQTITLEVASDNSASVASRVAAEIVRRLGNGTLQPYDSSAEAKLYAQLGQWSFARRLYVEAAQAYEAAIALGDSSPETRLGRMRAYAGVAFPGLGVESFFPAREATWGLDQRPESEFRAAVVAAIRLTSELNDIVNANWPGFDASTVDAKKRFYLLRGIEDFGETVLQAICQRQDSESFIREARELRIHCQRLACADSAKDGLGFADSNIHVGYLYERPEETIEAWRRMFRPDRLSLEGDSSGSSLRWNLWTVSRHPVRPQFVVVWPGTDPHHAREKWQAFIRELASSSEPLSRIDALALKFQAATDQSGRAAILAQYNDFLESNFEWVKTEIGQRSFVAFGAQWTGVEDPGLLQAGGTRFARILSRLFDEADWITGDSYSTSSWFVAKLGRDAAADAFLSASDAGKFLTSLDRYSQRMTTHARWNKADQARVRTQLKEIRKKILNAFPELSGAVVNSPGPVGDEVPLRAWRPPAMDGKPSFIDGEHLRWDGQRLLIPLSGPWMCSYDPQTLKADTFGFLARYGQRWSMDVLDGRMIVSANGLFRSDYRREPGKWTPVVFQEPEDAKSIGWKVAVHRGDFYFGTPAVSDGAPKQTLLVRYAGEGVEWKIASNRKPELHPLDSAKPRGFGHVIRSAREGSGLAIVSTLELIPTRQLVDLETGEFISDLYPLGHVQQSGDMDLEWYASKGVCMHILALDPNQRKPRLLFRDPKPANTEMPLMQGWQKIPPVFDSSHPEFQGDFIAPVFHANRLWLLKWEPDETLANAHGPNDLRLVCADPVSKNAIVIPIRDATDGVLEGSTPSGRERFTVQPGSLTATPHGFFFATDKEASEGEVEGSALRYLRWDDLKAWIARNKPEFFIPSP
jgi:hypothetical protein